MLEGLDQVEWANFWPSGGEAAIPTLLRALASPDPAVRKQAVVELPQTLVYQTLSTLEAASYAVPFLLELLESPVVEEKGDLLWLLAIIAKGQPFLLGAGTLDPYENETSAPPELQAELARQRGWVQRAYAAVEQGVPLYRTFLAHTEAEARLAAAHLLALFPAEGSASIPLLQARLDQEDDEYVLATVVVSLGTLLEPEATGLAFLTPYVQADYPPRLRVAAALVYARRARATTAPEVVQVLVEAGTQVESRDSSLIQVLYYKAAIGSSAALCSTLCEGLAEVDPVLAVPALITILHGQIAGGAKNRYDSFQVAGFVLGVAFSQQVLPPFHRTPRGKAMSQRTRQARKVWSEEGTQVEEKLETVNSLLEAAFSQESPLSAAPLARPGAPTLSPVQRAALDVLVDEDLLWGSDVGGMEQTSWDILLRRCGLPASRNGLRALLERPGAVRTEPLAPTFTEVQYVVVGPLVASDVLWESEPNLCRGLERLLMNYGLPTSRDALRDLLVK